MASMWSLSTLYSSTRFNDYSQDKKKLAMVLSNPAMMKVVSLQCDLFSLGNVTVEDMNGQPIENDPFLTLIKQPNPFQTQSQLLWDYMFWQMIGTSYCYSDSQVVDKKDNRLYFLDPSKMQWPSGFQAEADKLIFSSKDYANSQKQTITYKYADNTTFRFPLDRLIINTDLTNGIGNWYKGPSRIDALYKIITNSEEALNAKNINVRYSGKFLIGSNNNLNSLPLGELEIEDITNKMESDKKVWPIKTMVEIKRFVENMGQLQLDEAFMNDYYKIGLVYGIPKDVLEAFVQGSTYENQEKARMSHVTYCLQPKGNDLMNAFETRFGYTDRNIKIDWSHLPLAQVFQKDKIDNKKTLAETFNSLVGNGVTVDNANEFLSTSFVIPPPEATINDNSSPETLAAQAALRGSVGGVQGILAVQNSVSQGSTTYDAALSILTIIYGFTEQQAKDLLGKPKESQEGASNQGQTEGGGGNR